LNSVATNKNPTLLKPNKYHNLSKKKKLAINPSSEDNFLLDKDPIRINRVIEQIITE